MQCGKLVQRSKQLVLSRYIFVRAFDTIHAYRHDLHILVYWNSVGLFVLVDKTNYDSMYAPT